MNDDLKDINYNNLHAYFLFEKNKYLAWNYIIKVKVLEHVGPKKG